MSHNASKVLMGTTVSNIREVDNRAGTIAAGLVTRLKNDGTLSVTSTDGAAYGVSLGKSLSGTSRTAVCRKGVGVPIQLASGYTTPAIGEQVAIVNSSGQARAYTGSGDAYVNAYWSSGMLSGIQEDGTSINVALADFPGGL